MAVSWVVGLGTGSVKGPGRRVNVSVRDSTERGTLRGEGSTPSPSPPRPVGREVSERGFWEECYRRLETKEVRSREGTPKISEIGQTPVKETSRDRTKLWKEILKDKLPRRAKYFYFKKGVLVTISYILYNVENLPSVFSLQCCSVNFP